MRAIEAELRKGGSGSATVVDLGCGTGKFTREFLPFARSEGGVSCSTAPIPLPSSMAPLLVLAARIVRPVFYLIMVLDPCGVYHSITARLRVLSSRSVGARIKCRYGEVGEHDVSIVGLAFALCMYTVQERVNSARFFPTLSHTRPSICVLFVTWYPPPS